MREFRRSKGYLVSVVFFWGGAYTCMCVHMQCIIDGWVDG